MDIQAEKLQLIEQLVGLNDMHIIQRLKDVLQQENISVEQYNEELEVADREIDRGEYYTHQNAVERLKGWREK